MPAQHPKKSSAPQPAFVSVAVVVSDTKKARDWYTSTLGLDVIDDEDHWVTVGRKDRAGKLHLCQPMEGDPRSQLEPGNSGILLSLPGKDFTAECAALKARGVEFAVEPTKESWGTYAMIRDPDGNEHCLMPEA
ncbi:MAG: VOC family protein [Thermoplasmata archaeon]|jgi:catechol 2,3-dioxygenase-like lactoylglutathione lyase family enzyme